MNRSDAGNLAWALTDSAKPFIDSVRHTAVCAKIGAGEHDNAIKDLLVIYVNLDYRLPIQLAAPLLKWIEGYAGSDIEATLLHLYDRLSISGKPNVPRPNYLPPPLVAKRGESGRPADLRCNAAAYRNPAVGRT